MVTILLITTSPDRAADPHLPLPNIMKRHHTIPATTNKNSPHAMQLRHCAVQGRHHTLQFALLHIPQLHLCCLCLGQHKPGLVNEVGCRDALGAGTR